MSAEARPIPFLPTGSARARLTVAGARPASTRETDQPILIVGSRRDCDLFVNHPEVSKVHCAIVSTGDALIIVDLASRSGTYLNDQRVNVAALRTGDRLTIGPVQVNVDWLVESTSGNIGPHGINLDSPLVLTAEGQSFSLETLPAMIGRRQTSAVPLDTPDVSLAHALVTLIDGCPAIADLESRSGTFVNRSNSKIAWLADGDQLSIGGIDLRVAWKGPSGLNRGNTPIGDPIGAPAAAAAPSPEHAARTRGAPHSAAPAAPPTAARPTAPATTHSPAAPPDHQALEPTLAELRRLTAQIEEQFVARRIALDERERELASNREQHAAERVELDVRARLLDERERRLEQQSATLATREASIEARERNISTGEAAIADAARKMELFRAAIAETSRSLVSPDRAASEPTNA